MNSILSCIEDDAQHVLTKLKLPLKLVRKTNGTKTIRAKKAMLYCYLRKECKYSLWEIGTYCHKEHSTIQVLVNKYKEEYKETRELLLHNTGE